MPISHSAGPVLTVCISLVVCLSVFCVQELKAHLADFHGDHCKLKTFTSPSGHVQALAEFATVDAATNVLAQAHNSTVATKRLRLAFSNRSFH